MDKQALNTENVETELTAIRELKNQVVRGGKLVEDTFFIVVDTATGKLLGGKHYTQYEDAVVAQAELKTYAQGLEFVEATTPDLSDKAKVGKAKIIASYLVWLDAGKPVKASELEDEDFTDEEEAPVTEAPADTEEEEDDTF